MGKGLKWLDGWWIRHKRDLLLQFLHYHFMLSVVVVLLLLLLLVLGGEGGG